MLHSSTSNSNPGNNRPKLTAAGATAIAVFLAITILIRLMPDTVFVEGDSIVIRNMMLTETAYLGGKSPSPKILILGSSRLVGTDIEILSSRIGLPKGSIQNLSTPGATFFFIEAFLRRHPEITEELELLVVDILPYQMMRAPYFQESGPFFLRYATPRQRINVEKTSDRIRAVADFAVPAWSRSQPASAWLSGFRRSTMDIPALEAEISRRPDQDYPQWKELVALMTDARKTENGPRKMNAGIVFSTANIVGNQIVFSAAEVVRNQVDALTAILDSVPDSCQVALVWMPLSASTLEIVENSPMMIESWETFDAILDKIDDPALQIYRYSRPEQVSIDESYYMNDGIHLKPKGIKKFTRTIGDMYQK